MYDEEANKGSCNMRESKRNRRLSDAVLSCGLDERSLTELRPAISERNLRILKWTSLALMALSSLFLIVSLVTEAGAPALDAFQIIACALLLLARRHTRPSNTMRSLVLNYALIAVTLAYGTAMSFLPQNVSSPSVSFVVLLALMPLTVLDVAWRMYLYIVVSSATYLCLSHMIKPEDVFFADLVNVAGVAAFAMLLYTVVSNECVSEIARAQRAAHESMTGLTTLGAKADINAVAFDDDLDDDVEMYEAPGARKAPWLARINLVIVVVGILLSLVGTVALVSLMSARSATAEARDRYEEGTAASNELMKASDYLSSEARLGVALGNVTHMNNYLNEYLNEQRRDHAVEIMVKNGEGTLAQQKLSEALINSNELAQRELYAMKLSCEAYGIKNAPQFVAEVPLEKEDEALSADEKKAKAQDLVFGETYDQLKLLIEDDVNNCYEALKEELWSDRMASLGKEQRLHMILFATLALHVSLLIVAGVAYYYLVMRPLRNHVLSIQLNKPLEVKGSREVRNVALSYNRLYKDNIRRTMMLERQAQTDALTGLYNRGTFDPLIEARDEDVSLLIADVDLFKNINDEKGHEVGDKVLVKVAEALKRSFRATDYACRIGGDEFAVVLMGMRGEMRAALERKLKKIGVELADTSDGLPKVTLSIGVAFGSRLPENTNLYHAADTALYEAKHRGRNRYVFYNGELT